MNGEEVQVPLQIKEIAARIKAAAISEIPRELSPELYTRKLELATEYNGCYIAFWYGPAYKTRYLVVYRVDRAPNKSEYLPWVQSLFESRFAHSGSTANSIEFVEGDIYMPDESLADRMANSVVNYAEQRGDARE